MALKRVLGPFDATSVVIGAIIGVGIFFTPSSVAELAGAGLTQVLHLRGDMSGWRAAGLPVETGAP